MGEFVTAKALAKFGTVSATPIGLSFLKIRGQAFSSVSTNDEKEATLSFTSDEQSAWDFTGGIALLLNSNRGAGAFAIEISEMGAVVEFDIDTIESHKFQELYEETVTGGFAVETQFEKESEYFSETVTKTRTKTTTYPAEIDYVYCSGKGRKYGAWIDTVNSNNRTDENGDEVWIGKSIHNEPGKIICKTINDGRPTMDKLWCYGSWCSHRKGYILIIKNCTDIKELYHQELRTVNRVSEFENSSIII